MAMIKLWDTSSSLSWSLSPDMEEREGAGTTLGSDVTLTKYTINLLFDKNILFFNDRKYLSALTADTSIECLLELPVFL